MMKKSGIAETLEDLEDYSAFYDSPAKEKEEEQDNENAHLF